MDFLTILTVTCYCSLIHLQGTFSNLPFLQWRFGTKPSHPLMLQPDPEWTEAPNLRDVLLFQGSSRALSPLIWSMKLMEACMHSVNTWNGTRPTGWTERRGSCEVLSGFILRSRPLHYSRSCHERRERRRLRSCLSLNPIWHPAYFITATALFKPLNDTKKYSDIFKLQLTSRVFIMNVKLY